MVLNIETGDEYYYSLPPEKAVVTAFLQHSERDWNWWSYPESIWSSFKVKQVKNKNVFSKGNYFCIC